MRGVSAAGARDPVSDVEVVNLLAHLDDHTGTGVSEGHRLIHAALHRLQRPYDSLAPALLEPLSHQIRSGHRFLKEVLPGKIDDHALRAGRDRRSGDTNQDVSP